MSDILTLDADDGLDSIRSEIIYTKTRLEVREHTRVFVPPFEALLTRWTLVRDGQLAMWDAETAADALVAAADDDLDDRTGLIVEDVTRSYPKTDPVRQRFLGKDNKSGIVRMGLATQITRLEGWPDSLRATAPLAPHADPLVGLLTEGREALAVRVRANSARADHRVSEIIAFVDDVNGVRRGTYHGLGEYAVENKLPASYPKRFFRSRPSPRRTKS